MLWHCTRLEWREPCPQKCLRSCETHTPALSCMPISSSEQSQKLPVPAWSAANHVFRISGISPLPLPAQKALQKTPCCSHLNSLDNPFFCGKLLWTSLRCTALITPEIWLGETSPAKLRKEGLLLNKKGKAFYSLLNSFVLIHLTATAS